MYRLCKSYTEIDEMLKILRTSGFDYLDFIFLFYGKDETIYKKTLIKNQNNFILAN